MKVHFIAIAGSAMHNLAIALHKKGFAITGSDDEFFEPSKSRLSKYGLCPTDTGWHTERITSDLDAIILGMHARQDNPELIKAQELGLKIYSYPEYLYEQTKNKTRVVIGGSHGKTTTTSMIMHVLKTLNYSFDYLVGSIIEGFETMVGLSDDSRIAVFEGDEYLASPLDPRPKFHIYKPHIALITGIAWDHINVFPTYDNYKEQFSMLLDLIEPNGSVVYCNSDVDLRNLVTKSNRKDLTKIAYDAHEHCIEGGQFSLIAENGKHISLEVFGKHNMENIQGAKKVCLQLGVSETDFETAISTFKGSAKRLQTLAKSETGIAYLDFAHAPSKVKATMQAVKDLHPDKKIMAILELHTFSSLNKDFIPQYKGSMDAADLAWVYYNPETLKHKKLPEIAPEYVKTCFGNNKLEVFTNSEEVKTKLSGLTLNNQVLLIMTSGNIGGIDIQGLVNQIAVK